MALPINIESLLSGSAVESNQLEYKDGWNPDTIYRSICAFANDFEDTGGGYIIVGVKEEHGHAVRPVLGVNPNLIEQIEKDMVGYNNLIRPYYQPRLFMEEVDGKTILVIKVTAGERRPYKVPDRITAKQKDFNYYIRYNSSSIVPKDEYERELINLANRTPFDDRGNDQITLRDISTTLLRDFLVEVGSDLADQDLTGDNLKIVLDQMDLLETTPEGFKVKNVAAMMFCEHPEKFFKMTQVEIVIFPNGRLQDPDNMIEIAPIKGCVPKMIRDTMNYLKTNVIQKKIHKPEDRERSIVTYNYPYQALEEAVVNSLYHRSYIEREPVEITIEPDKISILNFGGPNHTISMQAIREARMLRSRRYTNRRLGEFLKELDLTEGRATGIPTIQQKLQENGSQRASIETDEERTFFLIDIPCNSECFGVPDMKKCKQECKKERKKELSDIQTLILKILSGDNKTTIPDLARKTGLSARKISNELKALREDFHILKREGGRKDGYWIIDEFQV